jgi:hypothetical protein
MVIFCTHSFSRASMRRRALAQETAIRYSRVDESTTANAFCDLRTRRRDLAACPKQKRASGRGDGRRRLQ